MRSQQHLELWGGVECTINRVGNQYHDQLAWSGHRDRVRADLESFARMGLNKLRTAVHWERFEETGSWDDADRMLSAMQERGMHPILGLLHHGSGPPSTHLLDADFPMKFAEYALKVAKRYPWAMEYTPINEPQTTARFSCLYRHWYPHQYEMKHYLRALYHQLKATSLAMAAIRSVQPTAKLIHTEDAGETFSRPSLDVFRQQREHRRWLGADLLCGRVDCEHALFQFLLENGLREEEVLWFEDKPCAPDIVGLNYYVTSDRFLDDRLHLYPEALHGGDTGHEPLVDVEAVRVRAEGISGAETILMSAWNRYGIPVAITEAHLGCEPEEQVRWLAEIWRDANEARDKGADVRAVTVWGLLGLYNWSNLCTEDRQLYEAGAFDLSTGIPGETALATLIRELSSGQQLAKYSDAGWWHQTSRIPKHLAQ